jgi:hypothetical protein
VVDLLPFSMAAIEEFLAVENPEYASEPAAVGASVVDQRPQLHQSAAVRVAAGPTTIGAFYDEIIAGLKEVAGEIGEDALFCGDPARQVSRDYYYAGGGGSITVTDLASACAALAEVVEQGEGEMTSPYDGDGDLAHYYRFEQVKYNRSYRPEDSIGLPTGPEVGVDFTAAYPMRPNPRLADFPDPALRSAGETANRMWSRLLLQIDEAFDGQPEMLLPAVHTMFKLRDAMLVLLANPLPGHDGLHAGPTFEWLDPEQ